jgi:hypothetical protein
MLNLDLGGTGKSYLRFLPSMNSWNKGKEEWTPKAFILLPDSVQTGWGLMQEGQAPDWSWDASPGRRGPQPSPEHKRGFSITLEIDGDETEWSSTGTGPVMGFQTLFSDVQAGMANNPGKVPVVEYVGSEPHKVGKGNTRKPLFKILKWVARGNASPAGGSAAALADAEF